MCWVRWATALGLERVLELGLELGRVAIVVSPLA
jgi:hypothetical protein